MEDIARRAGLGEFVTAPDMLTAIEHALAAIRAALPAEELATIAVLKTHAIPYVNYVTGEVAKDFWRVWVDAEMKA